MFYVYLIESIAFPSERYVGLSAERGSAITTRESPPIRPNSSLGAW
jgi:hypothetical protein